MLHWSSCAAPTPTPASARSTRPRPQLPGRGGGRHGRADGAAQPRLDADALGRHAGGARHRQGPLPGPGGRGGRGRDPVHREGRARADRRRLRAAAGGDARRSRRSSEGAPVIRDDKEGQDSNHDLPLGGRRQRRRPTAPSPRPTGSSRLDTHYPRCHPAPLECCGCVADVNPATGKATIYMTSQAPHAHRTLFALVAGPARAEHPDHLAGHRRRLRQQGADLPRLRRRDGRLAPDRPAGEVGRGPHRQPDLDRLRPRLPHARRAGAQGRQDDRPARRSCSSDNGAFFADAQPTKFKAGLFHIVTGSYDIPAAHVVADGAYTNKAPGGVAYRCSFRVTEASYLIERLVDTAAHELGVDPAELRLRELHQARAVPLRRRRRVSSTTRATTRRRWISRSRSSATHELREEQEEARDEGRLLGIGLASFTEVVGAGPRPPVRHRGAEDVRLGRAAGAPDREGDPQARRQDAGPGARDDVRADRRRGARHPAGGHQRQEGDTDNTPVRSRHVREPLDAGRRRRDGGHLAQAARQGAQARGTPARVRRRTTSSGRRGRFFVKGAPDRAKTIQELAFAAYTDFPDGMEAGLEGVHYYDPPNMTYPFGTYAAVVEVDRGTGQWKPTTRRRGRRLRRPDQPDDRRGSDHGRADRGLRDRGDAADRLRRGRQLHRRATSWTT